MKYLVNISIEYGRLVARVNPWGLCRKSKKNALVKARRYYERAAGLTPMSKRKTERLLCSRINRTPWRVKNQKYVAKANRPL